VGISWTTALHPPPPVPGVTMEEQSEVVATLRKGLRREAVFWLQRANDTSVQLRLEEPVVEMVDGVAVLRCHSSGLLECEVGDDVDLFFEMGGQSYSGVGQLLVNGVDGRMAVRVPRSLVIRNWRSLPRFKLRPDTRFLVSFVSPITGQHTTRAPLDLSVGGLSFPFDASSEIIPAGSRLETTLLLPDGTSTQCMMEVRSIHALPSDGRPEGGLRPFRTTPSAMKRRWPCSRTPTARCTPRGTWAAASCTPTSTACRGRSPPCASTPARGWSSSWPCGPGCAATSRSPTS
jgi:hypothetical protein